MTPEDVRKIQQLIYELDVQSLDQPIKNDDDMSDTYLDVQTSDVDVFEDVIRKDNRTLLEKYINKLSPREQICVKMRYGLYDGEPYSLESIGKRFGVTRERIRQVILKAILKLRKSITKDSIKREDF